MNQRHIGPQPVPHDMDGAGAVVTAVFGLVFVVGMGVGAALAVAILQAPK